MFQLLKGHYQGEQTFIKRSILSLIQLCLYSVNFVVWYVGLVIWGVGWLVKGPIGFWFGYLVGQWVLGW